MPRNEWRTTTAYDRMSCLNNFNEDQMCRREFRNVCRVGLKAHLALGYALECVIICALAALEWMGP